MGNAPSRPTGLSTLPTPLTSVYRVVSPVGDLDGTPLQIYTHLDPPSTSVGVGGGVGEINVVSGAYMRYYFASTHLSGRHMCTQA
ncbi:hypothetical protein E2C01_049019 [Portunus trituberculatus]|uniref:Uncharacterized protein n=1 Tax=Portunus trituberculatus TaxID=210409 RepID=A0A5B7GC24_PORTR|nr:hypothetical protein [Portunus trituberculatus]